jgi:hypothetical protein
MPRKLLFKLVLESQEEVMDSVAGRSTRRKLEIPR